MKSWKPYILIVFILLIGWTIILNRSARNKLELNRLESSYETLKEARDSEGFEFYDYDSDYIVNRNNINESNR